MAGLPVGGQMNELSLYSCLECKVGSGGKPTETFMEFVSAVLGQRQFPSF